MGAKPAPSANLSALPEGTELVGDYRIRRVLGAGGFGITYLADEEALGRLVTIKEYFPAEFAARRKRSAAPRSRDVAEDYQWGLDRFIEEAQTLARFDHPNIVRVHRYFRANDTAYLVLKFEEGGSCKVWLKGLKRAPRQAELDKMIAPLLDALEIIHNADFLHRDIAPDNIMVRKDGSPVLIDFGSARGAMMSQSRTVSALVKPGYSPYEQYATTGANQGAWTDIYALGATLYHALTGKRPPDAPSRVVNDEYVPARDAAAGSYRDTFLDAIDAALRIEVGERPQRIAEWRSALFAPDPARKPERLVPRLSTARKPSRMQKAGAPASAAPSNTRPTAAPPSASVPASLVPAPPDAPQAKGQLLDFIEALKKYRPASSAAKAAKTALARGEKSAPPARTEKKTPAPELAPEAPAAAGGTPAPAVSAATGPGARRLRALTGPPEPVPAQRRLRKLILSRRWRAGIARVAAAVAVASLIVAYQEHSVRSLAHPGRANEVATPAPSMQLVGHRGPVVAVASADGGRWIVSAGADATVRLWSGVSGALVRTIELSEGAVTAFAVDERRALVGHKGGTIVLWDLEAGERLATVQHGTEAITSLAFVGEGFVAARHDGSVALFGAAASATPAALIESGDGGGRLSAAARTRSLFVSSGTDRTIRVWRTPGPRLARTYRSPTEDITAIDVSPDAGNVVSGGSDGNVRIWASPALRPWPARTVRTLKAHDGGVTAVALGPAGTLATAGADGSVKIWSLHPAPAARLLASRQPARTLSFSRDGRRVFAGGEDGLIRVWSVMSLSATGAI